MKNALPLIVIAFVISGCAFAPYKPEAIQLPNGKAGYGITCTDDIVICYKRSGKACPAGYHVIDKTQTSEQRFIQGKNRSFYRSFTNFSLLIECKGNNVKRRKPKK